MGIETLGAMTFSLKVCTFFGSGTRFDKLGPDLDAHANDDVVPGRRKAELLRDVDASFDTDEYKC